MLSETEIYKSLGLSIVWSGLIICLAIYLNWDVVDLGKCLYIVVTVSTIHACLVVFYFYIFKLFSTKTMIFDTPQDGMLYVVSGLENPLKNGEVDDLRYETQPKRTIFAATVVLCGLISGSYFITLFGTKIFDGFSETIESWPLRNENIWGPKLLLNTIFEYLPFTILLLISLVWDSYRRIKTTDKTTAYAGIQSICVSYLYLIMGLVLVVTALPLLFDQNSLYYVFFVLTILPYTNFISLIERINVSIFR